LPTVKIGRRGQITIPNEIRYQIGLKEGDRLALICEGNQMILLPIKDTLLDLRGSVPVSGPQDFERIRRLVTTARAKKANRDEN
jgi:AbrB family looped-hinge helix DNA binding protein